MIAGVRLIHAYVLVALLRRHLHAILDGRQLKAHVTVLALDLHTHWRIGERQIDVAIARVDRDGLRRDQFAGDVCVLASQVQGRAAESDDAPKSKDAAALNVFIKFSVSAGLAMNTLSLEWWGCARAFGERARLSRQRPETSRNSRDSEPLFLSAVCTTCGGAAHTPPAAPSFLSRHPHFPVAKASQGVIISQGR